MIPPLPQRRPRGGMSSGIAQISPEWAEKQENISGDAPPGGLADLQLPTQGEDDYNNVLRGMAGQINQPFQPGWAALPGVASSVMGGLAAQKLRGNQRVDPERQLNFEMNKARLADMQKRAGGGGGTSYGKTGAVFQDRDGRQYTIQFGEDGSRKILPVEVDGVDGLTQSRGVRTVDTGTGTQIIDSSTGRAVREVNTNIAETERQKILGRESGQSEVNFGKNLASFESLQAQTALVNEDVDRALEKIGTMTTGIAGRVGSYVPGTDAYSLGQLLVTIKGNIGFDKLQELRDNSPTGGALGQVSTFELENLQAVLGSLNQAQSPEDMRYNLQRLKGVLAKRIDRRQKALLFEKQLQSQGVQPGTPEYQAASANFAQQVGDRELLEYNQQPRAPTDDPQQIVQASSAPPGAVEMLRSNPNLAAQFDAKYGQGAAAQALGQ